MGLLFQKQLLNAKACLFLQQAFVPFADGQLALQDLLSNTC